MLTLRLFLFAAQGEAVEISAVSAPVGPDICLQPLVQLLWQRHFLCLPST